MSAVNTLKQAVQQVCVEHGVEPPDNIESERLDPIVERFADIFAGLVLADGTAEVEQENRLMRARMERLQAERDGIVLAIIDRLERACGVTGMPPLLVRREFLPERPCVVHIQPDDTEGGAL